jgi:glycosyltransferase involved in cell wall biosynthesis
MISQLQKTISFQKFHISVIIPTYESAKTIKKCLKSLKEQSYPIDEIIIIDNFSKDDTQKIASEFGAKIILSSGTQASARNIGLANSKGDYILFLDSDQQADTNLIKDCVFNYFIYGIEAIKIPEYFIGLNFWGKCSAFWKNRMVKAWGEEGGIPRFYKRSVISKSIAFNDKLRFWEDFDFYQQLKSIGLKEAWCKSYIIHYEVSSLKNIIRKYIFYGGSMRIFKDNSINTPYFSTFKLTLSTIIQILNNPGKSLSIFLGCIFLVILKAISIALGFLLKMR